MEYKIYFARYKEGERYTYRYEDESHPLSLLSVLSKDMGSLEKSLIKDLSELKIAGSPKLNPIFSHNVKGINLSEFPDPNSDVYQMEDNEKQKIIGLIEVYHRL